MRNKKLKSKAASRAGGIYNSISARFQLFTFRVQSWMVRASPVPRRQSGTPVSGRHPQRRRFRGNRSLRRRGAAPRIGRRRIVASAAGDAGYDAADLFHVRMGESFDEFYAEAKRHPQYRWIAVKGAGRLLRCPTVFEDVVKMICTTNCSWALTEIMVDALVTKLGTNLHGDVFSFPAPEAIASHSESFLRKEIHCGYRAPYCSSCRVKSWKEKSRSRNGERLRRRRRNCSNLSAQSKASARTRREIF